MTDLSILGSKGESKQHTPVESPDSLINISYANILDGISEGPIVGLVNGAQSIYLDKTPLANSDGSLNFTGVTWEQRTGEHDQDHISGFPAVESQSSVGVELKASQPWVQSFSNLELSAVRIQLGVGALVVTEKDGDRVGYRVAYEIDLSTDDSDYKVVHSGAFDGKTTTGYQRSIRIDLPKATRGWRLRVRRTTPDSTTSNTQATTSVGTYTEIIDAKLQYPYTALCGLKIDASQFSSIPERAYRIRGRIIQVPSNYTPATRAYAGTWDGTFKLAWTDCPAWIWRDIVLNDRYGLGRFIDSSQLDKWALYQIARYCDEMVSDGKGGREPRFTCNVYLQSRADALTVLQDLASVFRGMSYYASSQVACAADMPGDPVYTYTNANVIDGKFSRAGSSGSTRFSVAKVAWSDRENFGNQRVEYVQDQKSLARYGVRETEITAFGCVSQGQAQRAGQYILLTNRLETGTITFSVGLDGTICRPGDVIRVADEHYAGAPLAGRIKAATASTVTLDDDVKVAAGDTLVVILPKGVAETRVVRSVAGRVVTVTQAFSAVPVKESVYTIETSTLVAETYRVLTVNENFGDDKLQYDVVAIARNNSKFAAIDDGAQIIIPPTSVLPAAVQAPPTNVKLSTFDTLNQGINIATMRITWNAARGAQSYRVWWKRNSGDWVYGGVTYTAALEVRGIYSGTYTARVSAEGVAGNSSVWALSEPTALFGKMGEPPALASLKAESLLFAIGLVWAFPPGAEDTQRTELWYSEGTDLAKATKLADLAYPQDKHTLQGLRAGQQFYFWARLVDKSGNIGPWFPSGTTLVAGMASADAGPILEQIKDQITASELGKALTSEIEKIKLIDGNGPGSVNERVGSAKTELARQISDVNNTLSGVKSTLEGQVSTLSKNMADAKSELQQQITAVSTLAGSLPYRKDKTYSTNQSALGSDGKLYQALKAVPLNTPPPNATYWTDVGQAVVTAAGTAASVTKLQTDVTTLGDKVTATSGKVDGFQASLNTTNDNVAKKADASAVSSLKTTVDQQGRDLTAQSSRMDGMQTSIDGKASSTALQQVTSRVTATEKDITSASSRTTALENTVNSSTSGLASKASTAALNSVAGRVTATEQGLTSAAESVSGLTASIKAANSAGSNIVPNATFDPAFSQMGFTVLDTADASVPPGCPFKYAARLASRDHLPTLSDVPFAPVKPGDVWRLSALVACVTGTAPFSLYIQMGTDPQTIKASVLGGGRVDATSTWTRTTWDYTVPAGVSFIRPFLQIEQSASGGTSWLATDWHMEDVTAAKAAQATADATASALSSTQATVTQQGNTLTAEGKRIDGLQTSVNGKASSSAVQEISSRVTATEGKNTTQDQQITSQGSAITALTDTVSGKANASTVQALSNTVTQQGQALTAAGQQLINISTSLAEVGSDNLVYNPSFEKGGTTAGLADGWWLESGGGTQKPSLPASSLAPGGVCQRVDLTGMSTSVWCRLRNLGPKNLKLSAGDTYTLSLYIRATAGLRVKAQVNGVSSSGAAAGTWQNDLIEVGAEWRRLSVTFAPLASTAEVYLGAVVYGSATVSAGFMEVDQVMLERGTIPTGWRDSAGVTEAAQSATAAAVDSLAATISQQGGTLSSVSGRTTSLENGLTTTNGNVSAAQQAAQAANDLAGGKGKVIIQSAAPSTGDRLPQNLWIDITGGANTPKRWTGSTWAAVTDKAASDAAAAAQQALSEVAKKADASAVQALGSRVTATEQGLTSAADSVTNLTASIKAANSAGSNIVPNATFDPAFSQMGFTVVPTSGANVPANCPFKYAARLASRDHLPTLGDVPFAPVKPGDVWRLSALVACVAGTAPFRLYIQIGTDPQTTKASVLGGGKVDATSTWTRTTWDYTVPAGVSFIRPFLQIEQTGNAGTVWLATDWHMEDVTAAQAAQATADATASALSSTQATVTQQGTTLTAEGKRIDGLFTSVGNNSSAIQDEATTRSNADSALSTRITTAQAKADEAAAAVKSEITARANAVSAVAKRVDDTQTSLGNTNAMVNRTSEAVTDLNNVASASEVVRVQITANGIRHAAGFAVGIENKGGVVQSTFAILASRFAILSPSGDSLSAPFAVLGNQTFIADAYIRDASITNAKIADASINSAKIADASIFAAKIGVAEIDTLRIRGNAVTVPISYSVGGSVTGAGRGQWMDILNVSIPMDTAGYVFVTFNCGQFYTSGVRTSEFTLEISGVTLMFSGGAAIETTPSLSGALAVGPGVHAVKVRWYGDDQTVSLANRTIFVMGAKR